MVPIANLSEFRPKIGVVGLGYVGLPVAIAFGKIGALVLGFDIDGRRVEELRNYFDRTLEVSETELREVNITLSADVTDLRQIDFFIVTVPTPVDGMNRPDMSSVLAASSVVGGVLKKGDIVVYESTVYPGATEDECIPLLEKTSGLRSGLDFHVGYSPERINPGDPQRRFENVTKVVSAQDAEALETVAEVYSTVVKAGVHRAPSIKVAEAAKVIENTQRDLNIALINELAMIFKLLDIDTSDVLTAAGTKWNFLKFSPGLVGGHCVGVDPYYLTYRAELAGYHPQVVLAGRRVNDDMGAWIAQECVKNILTHGDGKTVVILGATFKENVPDIRNSKVMDIISELESFGVIVYLADPLADPAECKREYGIKLISLADLPPADAVILAVAHDEYKKGGWTLVNGRLKSTGGLVMDIKAILDRENAPSNVRLWRM